MPNWNKHYVVDIAVLLALTFLTTIYSHPLLPTCHPEQRRRIPWKGTLWKIDCVQQYTTDVHNVSVPGDVSTALRSAQHDRQRRFCKFVFYACSLLINRLCVAYCYKPFANLAHENRRKQALPALQVWSEINRKFSAKSFMQNSILR